MKTARRFVNDESGITMALAIIMIVLIGVMGAGLLTFVSRDLNTVVEENRGQRAFEMADAGINVANRQLTADCGSNANCQANYNDTSSTVFVGAEDNKWSAAKGGLTLNDLDGLPGTSDNVNIQIRATNTFSFTVTATGNYGGAKRKIEAKLKGVSGGAGGGGNITYAATYSPSTIHVTGTGNSFKGMSLFSEKNIIINGLTSPAALKTEYEGQLTDPANPARNCQIFSTLRHRKKLLRAGIPLPSNKERETTILSRAWTLLARVSSG